MVQSLPRAQPPGKRIPLMVSNAEAFLAHRLPEVIPTGLPDPADAFVGDKMQACARSSANSRPGDPLQ